MGKLIQEPDLIVDEERRWAGSVWVLGLFQAQVRSGELKYMHKEHKYRQIPSSNASENFTIIACISEWSMVSH